MHLRDSQKPKNYLLITSLLTEKRSRLAFLVICFASEIIETEIFATVLITLFDIFLSQSTFFVNNDSCINSFLYHSLI